MKCANARKLDRKSGVRWGEPGAPVDSLGRPSGFQNTQVEGCGIPHLAKNERDMGHPHVCCGANFSSLTFRRPFGVCVLGGAYLVAVLQAVVQA